MVGGSHGFTTVAGGTSNLCTTRMSETRPAVAQRPIPSLPLSTFSPDILGAVTAAIHTPERPESTTGRLTPLVCLFGGRLRLGAGLLRPPSLFAEESERDLGLNFALCLRGLWRRRELHDVRRRRLERVDDGDTYRREQEPESVLAYCQRWL